jgi:hypothetical protein
VIQNEVIRSMRSAETRAAVSSSHRHSYYEKAADTAETLSSAPPRLRELCGISWKLYQDLCRKGRRAAGEAAAWNFGHAPARAGLVYGDPGAKIHVSTVDDNKINVGVRYRLPKLCEKGDVQK